MLLPGVTTLTRLIASIRERVAERLWQRLSQICSPEQRTDLEGLLARAGASRITNLERLRRAPSRASAPVLVQALARLTEVRQLDVGPLDLVNVPASRIKALAQYAVTTKAQNIVSLSEQHRTATLVSFGDFRKINCPSMIYYAVTREFPPDCLIIFKISYAFLVLGLRGATERCDPFRCSSEAKYYVRISLAASEEDIERGVREICAFADR